MKVEELNVFKKAHLLTLTLYKTTNKLPSSENFGLISQVRRASASINANLMEGNHRSGVKEYKHFVNIARGSCGELKYHLLLMKDLEYIDQDEYQKLSIEVDHISKMLLSLHGSLG